MFRNGVPRLDDDDLRLPPHPLVSVVIPALNEERYIVPLLNSLAAQDYGPEHIEVLVADGGSSDRTREMVLAYKGPFAKLLLVDNPRRSTSAGMNEGMALSRGDCWIILGAHSEANPDFVRQSVDALKRTGAACVGGPIETRGRGTAGKAIAAAMSSPFGVGDAKFRYSDKEEDVDTVPFGCYHRRAWEIVGGFDETIDGGDDDGFNAALREAGGRIVLVPEIGTTYYARESFEALAHQYWKYGAAKAQLMQQGVSLRPRHFIPSAMVAGGPGLFLAGARSKLARKALTLLAGAYLVLGAKAATKAAKKTRANPVLTLAAMATMHASYGAGFLWAMWQSRGS